MLPTIAPLLFALALIGWSWHFNTRHIVKNFKIYESISHMYATPRYRNSFRTGMYGTAILQIGYVLSFNWPGAGTLLQFGSVLFCIGAAGGFLLGSYSMYENDLLHGIGTYQYFLGLAFGAMLLSLDSAIPNQVREVSLVIVLGWFVFGLTQFRSHHWKYSVETAHVLLSYLWILFLAVSYLAA